MDRYRDNGRSGGSEGNGHTRAWWLKQLIPYAVSAALAVLLMNKMDDGRANALDTYVYASIIEALYLCWTRFDLWVRRAFYRLVEPGVERIYMNINPITKTIRVLFEMIPVAVVGVPVYFVYVIVKIFKSGQP